MIPTRNRNLMAIVVGLLLLAWSWPAAANASERDGAPWKDKGLVACWNCEAPHEDLVRNVAGGGLNATNFGASWTDGALDFDGVADYVSVRPPQWKLASLARGTLSVWFKSHVTAWGDHVQPVFYFGGPGGAQNSSLILELGHFWPDHKTRALYFTIMGNPGQRPTFCFDSNFDLDLDTWYHFVAVIGDGYNTGYLNGAEMTGRNYNFGGPHDRAFFSDVVNPGACTIGKGWFWTIPNPSYFDGQIGEVRVYDRALEGDQVQALYDEGKRDLDRAAAAPRAAAFRGGTAGAPAALLEARPNPFNPATRIRFSVLERGPVSLRVFDAGGRLVATLVRGTLEPGVREATWDGRNTQGRPAGSGVYFCRLVASGQTVVTKLILGR